MNNHDEITCKEYSEKVRDEILGIIDKTAGKTCPGTLFSTIISSLTYHTIILAPTHIAGIRTVIDAINEAVATIDEIEMSKEKEKQ